MPLFRPTLCEINTSALRHNYRQLKKMAGDREILGVVKANAYGHGATQVARVLASEGVRVFGVASVEEGIELRRSGIAGRIICFGGALGAQAQDLLEFGIEPIVFNAESVRTLAHQSHASAKALRIHLKVDTGMGRLGVPMKDFKSLLQLISECSGLSLASVMSHLASADEPDPTPTDTQIKNFAKMEKIVAEIYPKTPVFHFSNSAALIDQKMADTQWVRPGIAMYGAYPNSRFKEKLDLKPVMTWRTQIISLKDFPAQSPLSYGGTFVTQRPSKIAILPVGYADGYSRAFSNKGVMLVRGKRVPVVGRVCMDLTLLDVTDLTSVEIGDEVLLLGSQGDETLRAEELANLIGTISYEIFCGISSRVPRLMVNNGEAAHD